MLTLHLLLAWLWSLLLAKSPTVAIDHPPLTEREIAVEWRKCTKSFPYFVHTYCQVYDATATKWIPFRLWQAQVWTARTMVAHNLVIVLKARQLGLSWLVLAFALWLMLFRPAATILLFSRREPEAIYLLDKRLKGMYSRLPAWMQCREVVSDAKTVWELSNGSTAYAFPTSAGDSYTATLAIVDEADLVPDLGDLMTAVKPTIDGGGRMILLSRSDKAKPASIFKNIYRGAKAGTSPWAAVFLPWYARPSRDEAWYEAQRQHAITMDSIDDLHEQYPATDAEALAPATKNKRLPAAMLKACYDEQPPLALPMDAPVLPQLVLYAAPEPRKVYVIGGDPAEGNPTSDDSALSVQELATGAEVARLAAPIEPSVFASYVSQISAWYNDAAAMIERNNHGHTVLLWLADNSDVEILPGLDGRAGWMTTSKSKAHMYSGVADDLQAKETAIYDMTTYLQLASIEGASLSAPEGEMDDSATAFALGRMAAREMQLSGWTSETVGDVIGGRV